MKGMKPTNILPLARKDVEAIKKEARFVLTIDVDGNTLSCEENINGKISSIAVIGPSSLIKEGVKEDLRKSGLLEEVIFEKELLLLEIGFKRGKPYQEGFNRESGRNILWRRKWFYLSEKQHLRISPNLFLFLQHLCQETWRKWEGSKSPFELKKGKKLSFRNHSGTDTDVAFPGVRYSLSMEDAHAIADIFWADKNLNSVQKKYLSWFGNALANILSSQRSKKKRQEYAERWIYRYPLYFLERAANTIKNKYARANVLNMIWDIWRLKNKYKQDELDEMDQEAVEAIIKKALPNPEERMKGIQIRVKRIKRGCLVFEVFPEIPQGHVFKNG